MKTRISFFPLFAFIVLGLLFFQPTSTDAQVRVEQYNKQTFTSSFSTIVGQVGTTYLGMANSINGRTTISTPFAFTYDGVLYPAFSILNVNGCGSVNYGVGNSIYYNRITGQFGTTPSTYPNAICAMSGLQYVNGGVYYSVTGVSPNRVMTFEYVDARAYLLTSGSDVNYQIKMYETTNAVEFLYDSYNFSMLWSTSYWHGIGLNGNHSPIQNQNVHNASTTNFSTPSTNLRFAPLKNVQLLLAPKAVSFGTLLTGQASDFSVRLTHIGTESTMDVVSASFAGVNPGDFTIVSPVTPPTVIPIGGFVDYVIRFSPLGNGSRSAMLTFVTNGRDSGTQTVNLFGTGVAPIISSSPSILFKGAKVAHRQSVEQSIVISSLSQAALYFTSFNITGDGASDYTVSRMPMNPLPGGMTDTLKIRFSPTLEGARPAVLTINNNSINNPAVPITLKGIGIIPYVEVASSFIDHDSTSVTVTSCKKVTIINRGSDSLRILDHYFASADGDFSFTPLTGQKLVVAPNSSVDVDICFTPLQRGTRQARFRVRTNIPMTFEQYPRDTSSIDVEIRANGIPLDKSIIVQKDISDVIVGTESGSPLEFTNVGTEPVIVNKPIISGANASEFSVSKVNFPITVAPGASVNMTLTSKPTARGERTANVLFNITREDVTYTASTDVKSNALLACAGSSVSSLTFDKLILGESSSHVFEVSNCGDIEQTFTATLSGSKSYSLDASTVVVPAGGTANMTVSFAPSEAGVADATLTLKGSYVNPITVGLSGIGEEKPVTQSVGRTYVMDGFVLEQNAPNPALGSTNIAFTTPKTSDVRIYIADMTGKMVKTVANGSYPEGSHSVSLDTKDLSSGSYVYILESGNVRLARQMVITK